MVNALINVIGYNSPVSGGNKTLCNHKRESFYFSHYTVNKEDEDGGDYDDKVSYLYKSGADPDFWISLSAKVGIGNWPKNSFALPVSFPQLTTCKREQTD